jgi:hypothetical protein
MLTDCVLYKLTIFCDKVVTWIFFVYDRQVSSTKSVIRFVDKELFVSTLYFPLKKLKQKKWVSDRRITVLCLSNTGRVKRKLRLLYVEGMQFTPASDPKQFIFNDPFLVPKSSSNRGRRNKIWCNQVLREVVESHSRNLSVLDDVRRTEVPVAITNP